MGSNEPTDDDSGKLPLIRPFPADQGGNPRRPANPENLEPEIGGPRGPEPTRYGDWEQNGRCTDF